MNQSSQPNTPTTTLLLPSGTKSWYTTPNPFEQRFGYHRAVRRGPFIFVSGTTALKNVDDGSSKGTELPTQQKQQQQQQQQQQQETELETESSKDTDGASKVHDPTDARKQAQIAMERCVDAVEKLGGRREDVVRVKMFVSRHEDCLDVGEAFKNCFGSGEGSEVGATATMIVVQNGFVDPDILVEVEADAVVVE